MNKYMYQSTYKIDLADLTFTKEVNPASVLKNMEVLAEEHSELLGTGLDDALELGFFWILRSTKFVFYKSPILNDIISVKTWPAGIDGLRILRRYEYRIKDEIIGEAFNTWVTFDINTRKLIVSDYYKNIIKSMPIKEEDFFKLRKVTIPKDASFSYQKEVRNSDIDMNNHLNNVKYAEIIYNAIPHDILIDNHISEIQIDFMRESKLGDKINIFIKHQGNIIYINGKKEGHVSFRAKVILISKAI